MCEMCINSFVSKCRESFNTKPIGVNAIPYIKKDCYISMLYIFYILGRLIQADKNISSVSITFIPIYITYIKRTQL